MPRARKAPPGQSNSSVPEQPLRVPTGLGYGEAGKLENAQRANPLPNRSDPQAVLAAAAAFPAPDVGLGAPTQRPHEPVTAGLDKPLQPPAPPPDLTDVLALARHLPMLETLAGRPNASATTRAFVRRIRSMLPPDFEFDQAED